VNLKQPKLPAICWALGGYWPRSIEKNDLREAAASCGNARYKAVLEKRLAAAEGRIDREVETEARREAPGFAWLVSCFWLVVGKSRARQARLLNSESCQIAAVQQIDVVRQWR
jgi:hypothetical protein